MKLTPYRKARTRSPRALNVILKAIEHQSWTEAGQEVIGGDRHFF